MTIEQHLEAAISLLNAEISRLEAEGIRSGCLVESTTGNGKYKQHHWCYGSKRVYINKKSLPTVRAEIERGEQVRSLKGKLDLLEGVAPQRHSVNLTLFQERESNQFQEPISLRADMKNKRTEGASVNF